jgi:hypothetical protein
MNISSWQSISHTLYLVRLPQLAMCIGLRLFHAMTMVDFTKIVQRSGLEEWYRNGKNPISEVCQVAGVGRVFFNYLDPKHDW